MKRNLLYTRSILVLPVFLLSLIACDSPQQVSSPIATATIQATETGGETASLNACAGDADMMASALLNKALDCMKDITSYHFVTHDTTGQQGGGLEGDFESPDKLRMVTQMGGKGPAEILVIGKDWYTKQPGNSSYAKTDSLAPYGAAAPFEQLLMISPTITSTTKIGDEQVEGIDVVHIRFNFDASNSLGLATEVVPALGEAHGEVWIDKSTYYIQQQALSLGSTPQTIVTIYSKFNESVTPPIEKP